MQVPFFIPDGQELLLPEGTEVKYLANDWGLYVNRLHNMSFIVRRAKFNGVLGWRITSLAGVQTLSYANDFINTSCRGCLDSLKGD